MHFSRIFFLLSQESDHSAITSLVRSCQLSIYHQECLGKIQTRGAQYNAKKSFILHLICLELFQSHLFAVSYFCPRPHHQCRVKTFAPLSSKSSRWGGSSALFRLISSITISRDIAKNFLRRSALNFRTRTFFRFVEKEQT